MKLLCLKCVFSFYLEHDLNSSEKPLITNFDNPLVMLINFDNPLGLFCLGICLGAPQANRANRAVRTADAECLGLFDDNTWKCLSLVCQVHIGFLLRTFLVPKNGNSALCFSTLPCNAAV